MPASTGEEALIWRRSSPCMNESNCVEVARTPGGELVVRDSANPADVILISRRNFMALTGRRPVGHP
ncbi:MULTISPECIES: DUF397 domain-containing protein [unclassified Spirillospora]|uniref:DUF397 domain-containing protein n=1 Tax=unclassified Spirillospora TaxID=2642701 RepID=UPI00371DA750